MPGKASRFVGATAVRQAQDRKASMVDRVAATILAGDHGTLHRAGDRMDLCPKCNPEVDERLLSGLAIAPKKKRPRPASSKALKSRAGE